MGFLVHYNVTPMLRRIRVVYMGKTRCGTNYSYKRYENSNVSCVFRDLQYVVAGFHIRINKTRSCLT